MLARRKFLGYLAASLSPLATLTACGGGGSQQTTTPSDGSIAAHNENVTQPVLIYLQYPSGADSASTVALKQQLAGLSAAADRFATEGYCHAFTSAGSLAIVPSLPAIDGGDFAVSFWLHTTAAPAMRVLTLTGPNGTALAIDVNAQAAVSVSCNAADAVVDAGHAGDLSDGSWHHLVVQRAGSLVQLFVDGAAAGAKVQTLWPFDTLQVGGKEDEPWLGEIDDMRLHNRAFTAGDITRMVYGWQQQKPSNRADSVAAYYPFDGDAINNTGKGFDGKLVNVTPVANRYGDASGAYSFNGVDSFIELQDSFDRARADFAVAFWVRSSAQARMTALSISPGGCDVDVLFNDGAALKVVIDGHVDASMAFGPPGEFTDGRWHFVVLQRSGASLELYVDGIVRGTVDRAPDPYGPGSTVRIGRSSGAFGQAPAFWSGEIDDLQIYECSFTDQDLRNLELLEFRPRDGAAAVSFADRMWLLGGWNQADAQPTNNEVWASTDGVHWSFVAHAPWEGRHTAGCLVFDNRLWIIGGDTNRGHYQNDVWSSPDGIHWDFVTDQVPWADRATHYTLTFNDRMWLMGGQKLLAGSTSVIAYNDVFSSADGLSWKLETQQAPWSPRGLILGSVVFRGRMWVIGGGTYDVRTYHNDVWSSADGVHWDLVVEHAPWAPRQYHSVTVFDNKIWVVAGSTANDPAGVNDVWYSADGTGWTQVESSPWIARHAASVIAHGSGLWLTGGSSAAVYNDVWRLGYSA